MWMAVCESVRKDFKISGNNCNFKRRSSEEPILIDIYLAATV